MLLNIWPKEVVVLDFWAYRFVGWAVPSDEQGIGGGSGRGLLKWMEVESLGLRTSEQSVTGKLNDSTTRVRGPGVRHLRITGKFNCPEGFMWGRTSLKPTGKNFARAVETLKFGKKWHLSLWKVPSWVRGSQDHTQVQWFTRRTHRTQESSDTHGYGLWQWKDTDSNLQRKEVHRAESRRNQTWPSSCPLSVE